MAWHHVAESAIAAKSTTLSRSRQRRSDSWHGARSALAGTRGGDFGGGGRGAPGRSYDNRDNQCAAAGGPARGGNDRGGFGGGFTAALLVATTGAPAARGEGGGGGLLAEDRGGDRAFAPRRRRVVWPSLGWRRCWLCPVAMLAHRGDTALFGFLRLQVVVASLCP